MEGASQIRFISRKELDIEKWDRCIDEADNGLVYAYSFYLDTMSPQWDALVWNDYEAVMPLTWNRKWGIYYLYQPFLTAQLGVFGKTVGEGTLRSFLLSIPPRFKYRDIYLNAGNNFNIPGYSFYKRINHVLDLQEDYEILKGRYRENTSRNIRRAVQAGCKTGEDIEVEQVIGLAVNQMKTYSPESRENVDRFRKVFKTLRDKGLARTYGILSSNDDLLASAVFFFSHRRAYYILVGNHPAGRNLGASHALIDAFIRDHAGQSLILDFEGSDIPSLASFYAGFGAHMENYPGLKMNRLPFFLRWLKR